MSSTRADAIPRRLILCPIRAATTMGVLIVLIVSAIGSTTSAQTAPREARTEIAFVPIVGGDSDVGIGIGQTSALTRMDPNHAPYLWRIESGTLITFKTAQGFGNPYQDYFVLLALRGLYPGLRLTMRPSYTRASNPTFFGFGDAASAPPIGQSLQGYQYTHAELRLEARAILDLDHHLYLEVSDVLSHHWLDVPSNTELARELASPASGEISGLLGPTPPHFVNVLTYGVAFDTRDSEIVTRRGIHARATVGLSPGGSRPLPYRYGRATASLAYFTTRLSGRVTLAARGIVDALFGHPPFYELALYENGMAAFGGGTGVRGIPAWRYYGKLKAFGNLEARFEIAPFTAFRHPHVLGGVVFFDLGRLWADWSPNPDLDGTGLGLKYGTGLGIRVERDTTFVVRADIAWSPDARPIAGYFNAGQAF
jgi:hypothetical protein